MNKDIAKQQGQAYAIHNDLIQKSIFSMTLNQIRILLFMISKIKPKDDISTIYTISISDYCRVCNIDASQGWHYANVKNSLDEIDKIRLWIVETDENGKTKRTRLQWFHQLIINDGSGRIEYNFNENMKQYLFSLEGKYMLAYLEYILPMNSKYSIRLYNLLKSVEHMESVQDDGYHIALEDFKLRVDATKYDRYPDLRRWVIEKAVEEINTYTDIEVKWDKMKDGRSVAKLIFNIERPDDEERSLRRDKRLLALGHYRQPEIMNKYGLYSKENPPNLPEVFEAMDSGEYDEKPHKGKQKEEQPEETRARIRNKLARAIATERAGAAQSDFSGEGEQE